MNPITEFTNSLFSVDPRASAARIALASCNPASPAARSRAQGWFGAHAFLPGLTATGEINKLETPAKNLREAG